MDLLQEIGYKLTELGFHGPDTVRLPKLSDQDGILVKVATMNVPISSLGILANPLITLLVTVYAGVSESDQMAAIKLTYDMYFFDGNKSSYDVVFRLRDNTWVKSST